MSSQVTALTDGQWLPEELGEGFWSLIRDWQEKSVIDHRCLLWHQRMADQGLYLIFAIFVLDSAFGLCLAD